MSFAWPRQQSNMHCRMPATPSPAACSQARTITLASTRPKLDAGKGVKGQVVRKEFHFELNRSRFFPCKDSKGRLNFAGARGRSFHSSSLKKQNKQNI